MTASPGLIRELHERYGNTAFGLVSLLVVWLVIARPQLEASRQAMVNIGNVASSLERTASSLDRTVDRLDQIADRFESIAESMEHTP